MESLLKPVVGGYLLELCPQDIHVPGYLNYKIFDVWQWAEAPDARLVCVKGLDLRPTSGGEGSTTTNSFGLR